MVIVQDKNKVSIQRQYLFIAVILGLFIIIVSSVAYNDSINNTSKLVEKTDQISKLLKATANIRSHYHNSKRIIDNFMLEPHLSKYESSFTADITQIKAHLTQLRQSEIINSLPSYILLDEIDNEIVSFNNKTDTLFNIRIKANLQFPALGISATVMRPARNNIITAFDIIFSEFIEEDSAQINTHVFYDVIKAQKAWISTVSEFRLYLANRLGAFDEQSLYAQEKNIISYLDKLDGIVHHLMEYKNAGIFGFEGSQIIEELPSHLNDWREGLNQVIIINHSSGWRKDSQLMRDEILPSLNNINDHLEEIEEDLNIANHTALKSLKNTKTNLSRLLVGLVTLFILYILITIITLKHFIIKPIASIAGALKSEAFGRNELENLEIKKTKETQNLIDAFSEMSNQVYQRQKALEHQALSDALTSLPNRLMLQERLAYQIKIASRENKPLVLMMLDLNYFKEVNDTLGHHIGDQLLIQVGKRLKTLVRDMDTVARLGGDEFAILFPNTDKKFVTALAKKIHQTIALPYAVDNHSLQIGVSIGMAEFPSDTKNSHILMQYADVAMYHSKRNKLNYSFYDAGSDINTMDRLSISSDLKAAINNDELELFYQPKYEVHSKKLIGAEALLRWEHPSMGFIAPNTIIDTAIKIGLINQLSKWVIEKAIEDTSKFLKQYHKFNIAINLEVQNLQDESLHIFITDILQEQKIPAWNLSLEITESGMMTHPEQSIEMLNILNKIGLNLSIDDFGTGFSSLAYLKQLPVGELKIDKSFIINLDRDESDLVIVESTIQLAHNLGLKVVAEGVETVEVWHILDRMGCDYAQGYFMSKPLSSEKFENLLVKSKDETQS